VERFRQDDRGGELVKPKHCRRLAAASAVLLLALPAGLPSARAGTANPVRFTYGPEDGGVPTVKTDPTRFKQCQDPGPGQPFQTATPTEVGLDAAALRAAADFHLQKLQETLYVLRFGCLVSTGHVNALFETKVKHQWSITKPVSTSVLGIAVTKGFLSVDDPVGKYLPELDEAHGRVTVRQLLTHTQGTHLNLSREFQVAFNPNRVHEFNSLAFDHEPGTFFAYSQTGAAVLNAVVQRAVGRDFQDFAQDELFTPLGIKRDNWFWMRDAAGWTEGYAQLHMRPIDAVRLGQFWLEGMGWQGRRLVDPAFVADALTGTEANPGFGYQFWLNHAPHWVTAGLPQRQDEQRPMIASAPQDMAYSFGWRGRHHFVMPNLGMAVYTTPVDHDFDYDLNDVHTMPWNQGEQNEGFHEFFRLLMKAVTDQAVRDPGPWRVAPDNHGDSTYLSEPDQTVASRSSASNTDTTGMQRAGEDYARVATNPDAGPFVPLH
jgi:CubicO group peptidase (beta-lactamase class C family)